jgi:hypothetical protein
MKKMLLPLMFLVAFAGYGQNYKVIAKTAILYKNNKEPFGELAKLSQGETVTLIEKEGMSTLKVNYRGQIGYIGIGHVEEVPDISIPFNPETGRVDFTGIVEIEGVPQNELHSRAKQWIATTFKSANAVIQMEDKEEGIIVGKGISKAGHRTTMVYYPFTFGYTIKIYVKDGKYKYSFSDIDYQTTTTVSYAYASKSPMPIEKLLSEKHRQDGSVKKMNQAGEDELKESIRSLIASLTQTMKRPVTGSSDW